MMKNKLTIVTALVASFIAVAAYPQLKNRAAPIPPAPAPLQSKQQPAAIDVVFALDTTGSMSGLIDAAKEKIWSIAGTLAQADPAPEIRMGLVAYRDRGDAYVTQVVDLSTDLDSIYAKLMDFNAAGGGDGPESVNQALDDAINKMSWRQGANVYKTIFLVGDAPPHMDYQDDVKFPESVRRARQLDISINSIQAGSDATTARVWRELASLGQGEYFQVGQRNGNAIAISTPFDEKIAALSKEMDATRLYYGSSKDKAEAQRKLKAAAKLHEASSAAAQARRAAFNLSGSGRRNFVGNKELVDAFSTGKVELDDLAPTVLPQPMQAMSAAERKDYVQEKAQKRAQLVKQLAQLNRKRQEYLKKKVAAKPEAKRSLDEKIYAAVKSQAADKGLVYEAESARY